MHETQLNMAEGKRRLFHRLTTVEEHPCIVATTHVGKQTTTVWDPGKSI